MNGKLQTKSLSKTLAEKPIWLSVVELMIAFGLGALAITLHARLRMPLRLPGHHGLEFMAILSLTKAISQRSFTGTFFSFGVGTMLFFPFLSFSDPYAIVAYIIPGLVIDLVLFLQPTIFNRPFLMGIIGGIAYMTIPVIRVFITFFTGYVYKSLMIGPWYPLTLYFLFGFAGSFIVAGIIKSFRKNT